MSAGHDHGAGVKTRSLAIALALTGTFLVAELIGAYVFKSLALLSDAAHMFTDAAALAISLAAVQIGRRPPDDLDTNFWSSPLRDPGRGVQRSAPVRWSLPTSSMRALCG